MPVTLPLWLVAALPVALLLVAVMSGRLRPRTAAAVVLLVALAAGASVYRAGPGVLAVALGKGLWLGGWILFVVWPALLLYRLAQAAGLERVGAVFASVTSRRAEGLLLVAWIFPSFVQGVAGFGTPIAVAAPLLVAMGLSPVRAVSSALIGYHWSVTFGSMGSSFFMASFTARLDGAAQSDLALHAALLLGMGCVVAGTLVLLLDGGLARLREGARLLATAGLAMPLTLVLVARHAPAVATLAAATAGFGVVAAIVAWERRWRPAPVGAPDPPAAPASGPSVPVLLSPYLYLLATVLPVLLVPASRAWVRERLRLAPSFPATETGLGWSNPPVDAFTPLALLSHPGTYLLLACLLGYLTYRVAGLWPAGSRGAGPVRVWLRSLPGASLPVLLLAALATTLTDTGMVAVLARGIAEAGGAAYPPVAPVVGALGSFMTGSTTSSNALFAALQADVAQLLGLPPHVLVAAQTAGGNAGNSLAPVVALIGASAVGAPELVPAILRRSVLPVALLLAVTAAGTVALLAAAS